MTPQPSERQDSTAGVPACPKCRDSGWRPNLDANGNRIWTPLMNDALPCECGALRRLTAGVQAVDGPNPLEVGEAIHAAAAAIYFNDSSDYERALWTVLRKLAPGIAEVMEADPGAAYLRSKDGEALPDEAQGENHG